MAARDAADGDEWRARADGHHDHAGQLPPDAHPRAHLPADGHRRWHDGAAAEGHDPHLPPRLGVVVGLRAVRRRQPRSLDVPLPRLLAHDHGHDRDARLRR